MFFLRCPLTMVLFIGSGKPRIGLNRLRIARPGGAENADVVFAVAVPIAHHRLIVAAAQLRPQVAGIPTAVAVQVDEPLTVDVQSKFFHGHRRGNRRPRELRF